MAEIQSFFVPNLGTGLVQAILTMFNLLPILVSGVFLYALVLWSKGKRGGDFACLSAKERAAAVGISFGSIALFCVLSIWNARPMPLAGGIGNLMQLLWNLLNPIFSIDTMADSPFLHFTGLNLAVRVLMLCAFVVLIRKTAQEARRTAEGFGTFLEKRVYAQKKQTETDSQKSGMTPEKEQNASGESGTQQQKSRFLVELLKFCPWGGGAAVLIGYVFGSGDTRIAINDILGGIKTLLDMTTLAYKVVPGSGGPAAFLSNFLYIILSICILAVYGAILMALVIFLATAFKKRRQIMDWVVANAKAIWLCVAVVVLIVLACAVVFVAGSGFDAVKAMFVGIFAEGTADVFGAAANFLLLILALCVAMLMLGFSILFAIFIAYFGYQAVKNGMDALKKSKNILKYAGIIAVAVVGAGILLGLAFGYEAIRDGLESLFLGDGAGSKTPLWVVGHIFLLCVVVLGLLLAGLASLTLAKVILSGLWKFAADKDDIGDEQFRNLVGAVVKQLIQLLHLIPFTLQKLCKAGENYIATMLRIFVGYNTESEKNRAVFVAACFASLASLLNTFFGLRDFYRDDNSLIPVICSFAIACAVQLAMLIFGMKGGEGIAENIMSDSIQMGQGYTRAIVSKVFCCIFYLLIYFTAAVGVIGGLVLGDGLGFNLGTVLPILLGLLATVAFAYALVLQIMDIRALCKARKNGGVEDDAGKRTVLPPRRPRRILPRFYLIAYFLLMIVSTGFAFNNLFGYYAQRAHIHQQVYDQVRDQADVQLDLNQKVTALVDRYQKNTGELLSQFSQQVAADITERENQLKFLRDEADNDSSNHAKANNRDRFISLTSDLPAVVSSIKEMLTLDYDALGTVMLTVEEYAHYWRGNPQESYKTTCMVIDQKEVIGVQATDNLIDKLKAHDGYAEVLLPEGRYEDPYNSMDYSITKSQRVIQDADKYIVLKELLGWYDKLSANVNASSGVKSDMLSQLNALLDENAALDGVRNNLATLYREIDNTKSEEKVSILDLPRVVDVYLNQSAVDTTNVKDGKPDDNQPMEESDADQLPEKLLEYRKLSAYIDRALSVNNILAAADAISSGVVEENGENIQPDDRQNTILSREEYIKPAEENRKSDQSEEMQNTNTVENDTPAYKVRRYRNYAQGIAYSNFQISYDALLGGGLRLNEERSTINALYRSTTVAVFLLLICALVDLMAFFAGLLLFKDIFLFERNKKLDELGCLNYEAALTTLFTLPEGARERLLHLAVIYRLLYGDADQQHPDLSGSLPKDFGDMDRLHKILGSKDFQTVYDAIWEVLERLDIRGGGLADLRLWLSEFVKKNEIRFDDLFEP